MTVAITPLLTNSGVVKVQNDRVISFDEKPLLHDILINSGYYIFNRDALSFKSDDKFEIDLFPTLAKKKKLFAFQHFGFWYTFDTHNDLSGFDLMTDKWHIFRQSL